AENLLDWEQIAYGQSWAQRREKFRAPSLAEAPGPAQTPAGEPHAVCFSRRPMSYFADNKWAVSSAVEHCFHTAGVTGSIPVPPTTIINGLGDFRFSVRKTVRKMPLGSGLVSRFA